MLLPAGRLVSASVLVSAQSHASVCVLRLALVSFECLALNLSCLHTQKHIHTNAHTLT